MYIFLCRIGPSLSSVHIYAFQSCESVFRSLIALYVELLQYYVVSSTSTNTFASLPDECRLKICLLPAAGRVLPVETYFIEFTMYNVLQYIVSTSHHWGSRFGFSTRELSSLPVLRTYSKWGAEPYQVSGLYSMLPSHAAMWTGDCYTQLLSSFRELVL